MTTTLNSEAAKDQVRVSDPHRVYNPMRFKDTSMDFIFQFLLGSTTHGGCEIGEAFYTASLIEDGNPESWEQEWPKLANRVRERAEASLQAGCLVSAREAFLRAANYYRAPLTSMLPENPSYQPLVDKFRACFHKAAALFDPPIEPVKIAFENTVLPGYFIKADHSNQKRKTLIMIGGAETFAEDLYFYTAPAALKRGYNFLTVDLPGQGIMPFEGQFFRADTETPMKAVIDYALQRPDVDPERLAAHGISGGGYFVPRAAAYDHRIKACIADSWISDLHQAMRVTPMGMLNKETAVVLAAKAPYTLRMLELIHWRWGVPRGNGPALVEAVKDHLFDVNQFTCPVLMLVGEGEFQNQVSQAQHQQAIAYLPNPQKEMVVVPANMGGAAHCINSNLSLMNQVVFDWLDKVFE